MFTVSLTLALSEAPVSQQIKLPKLDRALAGRSETSPGDQQRNDGFLLERGVWQRALLGRPLCALLCWLGGPNCAALHLRFLLHDEAHRALHDRVSHRNLQDSHQRTGEALNCVMRYVTAAQIEA